MTEHHKTTVVSMRTDDEYDMRVDRRSPWGNPYKPANDTAGESGDDEVEEASDESGPEDEEQAQTSDAAA